MIYRKQTICALPYALGEAACEVVRGIMNGFISVKYNTLQQISLV